MSTKEMKNQTEQKKQRSRLLDETGKRLLREIKPLRGWTSSQPSSAWS